MIKRKNDFTPEIRENMRGGDGHAELCNFITPADLCGIGYHIHENDCELFYIMKGTAVYSDNGEEKTLAAGDVAICPAGTGHAIKNAGDETLEFVALIVYA